MLPVSNFLWDVMVTAVTIVEQESHLHVSDLPTVLGAVANRLSVRLC
jgi:hypothetical protein